MSVRRLSSLMHGLGYKRAEASSRVSEKPSPQSGLAKLVAMRPRDMAIVYSPKKEVSDGG